LRIKVHIKKIVEEVVQGVAAPFPGAGITAIIGIYTVVFFIQKAKQILK
jgi:hypothetical protein